MFKASITLIVLFLAALQLANNVSCQPVAPTFIYAYCRSELYGNYTTNSIYESNLRAVIDILKAEALINASNNASAGNGADTVYGQYYCRGDVNSSFCGECIKQASVYALSCSNARAAIIWYQECTLRYMNESMYGVSEGSTDSSYSLSNVTDPGTFSPLLNETVTALIQEAVTTPGNSSSVEYFAYTEKNVSDVPAYFLVQCSPDLSPTQCESCLVNAFDFTQTCCGEWPLFIYTFSPSCQVLYDTQSRFYFTPNAPPSIASPPSAGGRAIVSQAPPPPPPPPPSPPPSIFSQSPPSHSKSNVVPVAVAVAVTVAAGILLLLAGGVWFFMCRKNSSKEEYVAFAKDVEIENVECVSLGAIEKATMKFSTDNKLGRGGFGTVYKGMLPSGEFVAIKRLTKYTEQGIREFKTEIAVVAKLQHKNLVKLQGYCVEHQERILIYEFMSNLSLDKFLFDTTKSIYLDWSTRYKIIQGIACGLQYLHESLIAIVHRDLKSSNILLDGEMNPKIADFGLAKLFNIDDTTGNTTKVAGTFGYMAPEYAMAGRYSTKSDIYSFGVIILEILSGISVFHFYDTVTGNGLLLHGWRLWNERTIEGLIDPILKKDYPRAEVERCAQIGLLCVQDDIARRPTIRALISMLDNRSLELPSPVAQSTFFQGNFDITSRTSNSQGEVQTPSSQAEYQHSTSGSIHTEDLNPR